MVGSVRRSSALLLSLLVLIARAQVYFILLLYSFASHLRLNTYRALPLTTATPNTPTFPSSSANGGFRRGTKVATGSGEGDEEQFAWDSDDETSGERRTSTPRGEQIV